MGEREESEPARSRSPMLFRNLLAFWFFGLCNNFGYVVMLSAATDILAEQEGHNQTHYNSSTDPFEVEINGTRACNALSTGAVLLADILPTLIVKSTAAFFMERIPFGARIFVVVLFQIASYLLVAFSTAVAMSLFGVICASFAAGLGEITFLSMASYYDADTISTWSSGTGGAGVVGAFAYAGITQAGFSPENTLLVMLVVPVLTAVFYWIVLKSSDSVYKLTMYDPRTWIVPREWLKTHVPLRVGGSPQPGSQYAYAPLPSCDDSEHQENEHRQLLSSETRDSSKSDEPDKRDSTVDSIHASDLSFRGKLVLIKHLLKYMIPLGFVYAAEYFINQGLMELIYFNPSKHPRMSHKDQYRWYQVDYQLGVLISRSSVNLIQWPTKLLWLLPALQIINAVFLLFVAIYRFLPSIWIVFVIVFYEGLLGGTAYVNTFYKIRNEVAPEHVEYSLGVASLADSTGIVVAGIIAIPLHNWICSDVPLPSFHY